MHIVKHQIWHFFGKFFHVFTLGPILLRMPGNILLPGAHALLSFRVIQYSTTPKTPTLSWAYRICAL